MSLLTREWVEIVEDSTEETWVFRPLDYPMPPSRGGRRRLELQSSGDAVAKSTGRADAMEISGRGTWSCDNGSLLLDLPGWSARYEIKELKNDLLVIKKT